VEPLEGYVMSYTAFGPQGPRIALAISKDLVHWQRLGLVNFTNYYHGRDPDGVTTRMQVSSPWPSQFHPGDPNWPSSTGHFFPGTRPEEHCRPPRLPHVDLNRESIWLSYCERSLKGDPPRSFGRFASHHRLASPVSPWSGSRSAAARHQS